MAPKVDDVSVTEFADLCGVTSQRVYQYVQEGMPHRRRKNGKTEHTRIVPREGIRWLIDRAGEVAKAKAPASDDRARILRADAELRELEVAERRRELVPAVEVVQFSESFVGGLAAVAAGQLQRFERKMIKVSTPGEARRLTSEIHAALMAGAGDYANTLDAEAAAIEKAPAA